MERTKSITPSHNGMSKSKTDNSGDSKISDRKKMFESKGAQHIMTRRQQAAASLQQDDFRQESDIGTSREKELINRISANGNDDIEVDSEILGLNSQDSSVASGDMSLNTLNLSVSRGASYYSSKDGHNNNRTTSRNLFVDTNAQGTMISNQSRRDATPKVKNQMTPSPETPISLNLGKKREDVTKTLATVVQQVDNSASAQNQNAKIVQHIEDDSSEEVDRRWAHLSAKLLGDDASSKRQTQSNEELLDQWRDTLLDVNSPTSPRSNHWASLEEELIQDCLETGSLHPKNDKGTPKHEDPRSYPPTFPTLKMRPYENGLRISQQIGIARIDAVPSALTVDEDTGPRDQMVHHVFSSFSENKEISRQHGAQILQNFSAFSDDPVDPSRSSVLLEGLVGSESESEIDPVAEFQSTLPEKRSTLPNRGRDRLLWWRRNGILLVNEVLPEKKKKAASALGKKQREDMAAMISMQEQLAKLAGKGRSTRAPQPAPDALSSNSRDFESKMQPERHPSTLDFVDRPQRDANESPRVLKRGQEAEIRNENQRQTQSNPRTKQNFIRSPDEVAAQSIQKQKAVERAVDIPSDLVSGEQQIAAIRGSQNIQSQDYPSFRQNDTKTVQKTKEKDVEMADPRSINADILDVASTLTSGSSHKHPNKILQSTQFFRHATNGDENDFSRSIKSAGSFNTKIAASLEGVPSWRMGPNESLSDFTLEVVYTKSGKVEEYHLHKHVLGIGPRRSLYLEEAFRSNTQNHLKIFLVDQAVPHFSDFLDFVYCHDFEIHLATENVMAFRYLSRTFKVLPVVKQTSKWILDDIKIANMGAYITCTSLFGDETLRALIAALCGEQIEQISPKDVLWTAMEPDLFLQVVSCPRINRAKFSPLLSILLVEYHTLHQYEMDAEVFLSLTSETILPVIDRAAAIPILEICEQYDRTDIFETLQKRCAQVIACFWKVTSDQDRKRLFSLLRGLPSNFTVDFLEIVETGNTGRLLDTAVLNASIASRETAIKTGLYRRASSFTIETLCDNMFEDQATRTTTGNDPNKPLSWRMSPGFAFSDWKVKVKHRQDGQIDTYTVHKHILAIGQYRSNFFAEAFLAGDHGQAKKGTTMIELAKESALLFPSVLDFMYSTDRELDITTKTAVVLRFLARVFGVWMLNKKILEFVDKDMELSNMLSYIRNSEMYDDERILNLAIRKCATDIGGIKMDSELLIGMKPEFFGRVISSSEIDKTVSCHINILIIMFFTMNSLDEDVLAQLLQQKEMTTIDFDSALKLLDAMCSLTSTGVEIFDEIRRRCGVVLAENWKEVREDKRKMAFRIFKGLDSVLLGDVFDAVESEYYRQSIESMSAQSKLVKRYRSQLEEAQAQRESEVAQLKQEMDQKMSIMMERERLLEAELARRAEEMAKEESERGHCVLFPGSTNRPRPIMPPLPDHNSALQGRNDLVPNHAGNSPSANDTPASPTYELFQTGSRSISRPTSPVSEIAGSARNPASPVFSSEDFHPPAPTTGRHRVPIASPRVPIASPTSPGASTLPEIAQDPTSPMQEGYGIISDIPSDVTISTNAPSTREQPQSSSFFGRMFFCGPDDANPRPRRRYS